MIINKRLYMNALNAFFPFHLCCYSFVLVYVHLGKEISYIYDFPNQEKHPALHIMYLE